MDLSSCTKCTDVAGPSAREDLLWACYTIRPGSTECRANSFQSPATASPQAQYVQHPRMPAATEATGSCHHPNKLDPTRGGPSHRTPCTSHPRPPSVLEWLPPRIAYDSPGGK